MAKPETVLLTGASGYIGKHIAAALLNAGYHVVGSVRSMSRGAEVVAAVTPVLNDAKDLTKRLSFVELNLTKDDGWADAMKGVDVLMHTASPFPLAQPKDENELIKPAVDGALRALRAAKAAGIKRVVFTSSSAAVMDSTLRDGQVAYDESNWTDLKRPSIAPYIKSKTMAEQAAWDFVADEAPEIELTTINPVLVLGPPLDKHFGTSVGIIQRLLRARDPMLPNFGFPCVDVRDIADMHVSAIKTKAAVGKRIIGVDRFVWFHEMAAVLKVQFPNRRVVTRRAPNFVVRFLAIFDHGIRNIVPNLGVSMNVSNQLARDTLGTAFIPSEQCIRDTADFLVKNKLV